MKSSEELDRKKGLRLNAFRVLSCSENSSGLGLSLWWVGTGTGSLAAGGRLLKRSTGPWVLPCKDRVHAVQALYAVHMWLVQGSGSYIGLCKHCCKAGVRVHMATASQLVVVVCCYLRSVVCLFCGPFA